ncbi:hypothetical protein B0H12DRAFT_1110218 [Mycena haematopus]|nr:hypothetical protein B0H12DRAFT_1110218 [Mycena haematopus]
MRRVNDRRHERPISCQHTLYMSVYFGTDGTVAIIPGGETTRLLAQCGDTCPSAGYRRPM